MAKTLTTSVNAGISWQHINTVTSGAVISDVANDAFSLSLTDGTGSAGTADLKYENLYTLTSSATQSIDLAGSVADQFGATITMARVKVIYIRVLSTAEDSGSTGGPIVLGNGTNPLANWISDATETIAIGKTAGRKSVFLLACDDATGYALTGGASDVLKITNASGSLPVKVRVVIIGSSA